MADRDPMSDERRADMELLHQAVNRSFELSLRYLAVCKNHIDGVITKYGPFASHDDALEQVGMVLAGDCDITVEEMHDWNVQQAHINRWHDHMDEKRKLERAKREAVES
jgi:hypothetical protein